MSLGDSVRTRLKRNVFRVNAFPLPFADEQGRRQALLYRVINTPAFPVCGNSSFFSEKKKTLISKRKANYTWRYPSVAENMGDAKTTKLANISRLQ